MGLGCFFAGAAPIVVPPFQETLFYMAILPGQMFYVKRFWGIFFMKVEIL
jgi:hypothetical protein